MAYTRYRDVPYQRSTLISNDRLDYMENGIIAAESGVDGLEAALNDKADDPHTHAVANITGLQGILEDLEQRLAALEPEP